MKKKQGIDPAGTFYQCQIWIRCYISTIRLSILYNYYAV